MSTVPVFAPDGRQGDIPSEQLPAALKAGAKPGVNIIAPDGRKGVVPSDRYVDAAKAGAKIAPFEDQDIQHPGFWKQFHDDVVGILTPKPGGGMVSPYPGVTSESGQLAWQQAQQAAQSEKDAGYSVPYRAAAALAHATPVNVAGMEQSAKEGDVGGVLGHAAAGATLAAAPLAAEGVVRGAGAAATSDTGAAIIRNTAKVANAALKKAPGTLGTAAGAAIGAASHVPYGAEIGAGLGGVVGRELLPQLKVPGEGFGFPDRVEGGPATVPPEAPAQPAARTVTTDPATGRPEFSDVLAQKSKPANAEQGTYFGARAQDFPGTTPARNLPGQQGQGVSVPGETNAVSAARQIVTDPATGRPEFSDVLQQKAAQPEAAEAKPAPTVDDLAKALNDALGGKPLAKGVPLRDQLAAAAKATAKPALPEGFTPVDSSVLRGYKYDPDAKEFSAITNSGQTYTHGEVTPEQVKAFTDAESQGKAWTQQIRNNNPLVAKNGRPVRPAEMGSEAGVPMPKSRAGMNEPETETHVQDLTDLLLQSLAKAKK